MTKYLDEKGLATLVAKIKEGDTENAKMIYENHATVSGSASPNLIELGVATKVTISASGSIKGGSAKFVEIGDGSKILAITKEGITSASASETISQSKTYTANIYFPNNVTKTVNIAVTAKDPIFYFSGAAGTPTEATIKAGTKLLASGPSGAKTFNPSENQYLWLCVPNGMSVNGATLSGFDFPLSTKVTVEVTLNGHKTSYNCYRSQNAMSAGQTVITFK